MHSDGNAPLAVTQCLLQLRKNRGFNAQARQFPGRLERLLQPLHVALGFMQLGLGHFDEVQMHARVERDVPMLGALPDHLAMHLALGRHVDDEVAPDLGLAAEPAALCKRLELAPLAIASLDFSDRGEVPGTRGDRVLGKFTLGAGHLATPAQAASAAYRVHVDTETPRRIENRRTDREYAAPPRRRENDFCLFSAQ